MKAICHDWQYFGEHLQVVLGIESIHDELLSVDTYQHLLQQIQTQITVVGELVAEGPDNTVEDGCEVGLFERVEHVEVVLNEGFQEEEEVCADLWEGVEVSGDEW